MLNPYVILVVLAVLGVTHAGAYITGGKHRENAITAKAEENRKAEAKHANDASGNLEKGNAKAKVVYRNITHTVDKIVERPVYRNVCLDPDGVLAANAALTGTVAGESHKPVPVADTSRGWFRGLRPPKAD